MAASGSPEANAAPNLNAIDRNMLLVWFMLHMLSVSGFQPNLSTCLACDGELQPETNFFNAGEGGFYCPRGAEAVTGAQARAFESVDADVLKIMRFAQSKPWGEVRKFTIRPCSCAAPRNLLQRYMMSVLEHHLRSVDFLRRLQNDLLCFAQRLNAARAAFWPTSRPYDHASKRVACKQSRRITTRTQPRTGDQYGNSRLPALAGSVGQGADVE